MGIKVISKNSKAFHEYSISDTFEAGIGLVGTEVKSLRLGKVNLSDGWIEITDDHEALARDIHIGKYSFGNLLNHDEKRPRKLLLHKHEIRKIQEKVEEKGCTAVPLKIYFKGPHIKLEIGIGKGKKLHDKRETEKRKTADREMARAMRVR